MTPRMTRIAPSPSTSAAAFATAALIGLTLAGCGGTRPASPALRGARPCADTVRVAETRIVAAEDAGKLTLGAAVDRMSQSLLRAPEGTAWKPEAARAIEIRDHRADLSILVEDAEWVLALSTALDGPLPAEDKARLRRLHERYAAHAPHAEVAAQVTTLLETVRDENLRRELKKLANRSWERERRMAARSTGAAITAPPASATPASTASRPSVAISATTSPSLPAEVAPSAKLPADTASSAASSATADSGDAAASPERYCADRRADAARSFADARNATDASARERLLNRSLESLDACITRFPDAAEATKARQNRARVAGELKR